MHESYRTFVKGFYRWTTLLSLCTLIVSVQDSTESQEDLKYYADAKVNDFKSKLHQKLLQLRFYKTEGKKEWLPSITARQFEIGNESIIAGCVVRRESSSEAIFVITSRKVLSLFQNFTLKPIHWFPLDRNFIFLQGFEYGKEIWMFAHHISRLNRHKIRLYQYNSLALRYDIPMLLPGPSLVSSYKSGYRIFVAFASLNAVVPRFMLYQWIGTQLDEVYSTDLDMNCASMALWIVDNSVYVALSFPEKKQLVIHKYIDCWYQKPLLCNITKMKYCYVSEAYLKHDELCGWGVPEVLTTSDKENSPTNIASREYMDKMKTVQFLVMKAYIVKHFEDSGSHYIVCGITTSVVLFWWSGSVFLRQQEIFFNRTVADIVIHGLGDKVVIAAVFTNGVEFLVQDASSLYINAGSILHNSLKSVILWESGGFLYMMPLSNAVSPLVLYQLNLTFVVSVSGQDTRLENCLETLAKTIDERQELITSVSSGLKKVWLPTSQHEFVSLHVYGSIVSLTNATIRSMRLDAKTKPPSTSELGKLYRQLVNTTQEINSQVKNSVLKSSNQTLRSILNFMNLTVRNINGKINFALHTKINDVPTDRLFFALRNHGQQTITSSITVSGASCRKTAIKYLNYKKVEDFVLLGKSSQILNGNFTFGNVTAENILLNSGTINSLNIYDIVLASKPNRMKDFKIFKNVIAKSIRTNGSINEIDFRKKEYIVYVDSMNSNQLLNFTSSFTVDGDLTIISNDSFVSDLCLRSVKKNASELIRGNKNFASVTISGHLNIAGKINNFTISNLMNLNAYQIIHSNISFSHMTSFFNIETNYVNNINISSQAYKRFENGSLTGTKTFTQTLTVTNITLKEGITIDSFDPSAEVKKIVTSTHTTDGTIWIRYEAITMGSVVVNNYSEIYENRDDFPLLNVLGNVWLKSTEQNIHSIKAINISVTELGVSKVNGITLDDLVLINGDTNITAPKEFADDVNITTLSVKKGKNLNVTQLWKYKPKIIILNNVTMDDALLESNLNVTGTINGVGSFLHVKEHQILSGEIKFDTVEILELNAKDLNFDLLNSTNFTNYLENAVLSSKEKKVLNKIFTHVAGAALESNGYLNGIDLQKVATLNTAQNITASFVFNNSLSFKKLEVEKIFDDLRLDDLVYTDSVLKVSNKLFNGTVTTPNLQMSGFMSDINITDLGLKAFNRSGNVFVEKIMIFNSTIQLTDLQLAKNKTLDEVNFKDLILLNDTVRLESFNSSSISTENITLFGLINNCNLTSILESALYRQKFNQNITAKTHVESLVIDGNLLLESINSVWIDDIISLLNQSSDYLFDKELVFENISVKNIYIQDFANNFTINSVFDDAVRKSVPQVINGTKIFKEISSKTAVIAFLDSKLTCGVNVTRMHELSINRTTGNKTIHQQKIFSVSAKRVTIQGTLNKSKFPNDFVLVNETHFITGDNYINGTVNVTTTLQVFGNIDGVAMGKLLGSRLTLSGNEESDAILSFEQEASLKESTIINGTINGLRISDIVSTVKHQTLNGTINFTKSLDIEADLTVNGSVNGLLLQELISKVLLSSKNETMNDTVEFSSLNVSSLECKDINGLNIIQLYDSTHNLTHFVDDKLYNFTLEISDNMDLLRAKMNSANSLLPIFSYFEIHQFLTSFGLVERFLPVYEYGVNGMNYERPSNRMVVWVKQNYSDCWQRRSIFTEVLKNGTLKEVDRIDGKIFPLSLRTERDGVLAFMLHSKSTPRCSEERIVIKTLLSSREEITNSFESPANATLKEALLVEMQDIFLITAYSREGSGERIFVHQYNTEDNSWSFLQKFYEHNLTALGWTSVELSYGPSSFFEQPEFYLAVTGDEKNSGISVFEWDFEFNEFTLKMNVTTSVSSSLLWVSTENILFLLLAKEKTRVHKDYAWKNVYSEPIEIYSLDDELFLNHTVSARGVRSLEMFIIAGEIYVLASSPHMETLYVIQYRGYNGFEVIQEISCPGITSSSIYTVENHVYLAMSSSTGHSRILKAAIRGEKLGLDLFNL